ncbi:MAG: 3-methyl-2-oxobutanoate hydroxymethyltransferase [Anaerolineales bacterium]|nr:3-methyl-2-oxobutanoate hydroxymethyltransferase [Anaerolineales bacterium]MCK5427987.1 3-methyl-2-oxobutanoate hydroxymethyltransferase [Anaerolineales bacterium]
MSTTPTNSPPESRKKITTRTFRLKKQRGEIITMLTAYDYPTALAIDQAGIDSILVGDSLGMVVLGYPNTLPVTMQDMLHHCQAVARGAQYAFLIGDMPFMSYQSSVQDALHNAGRFLQEAGMDAVKLEGGKERLEVIQAIISAGIPVMGHLGLTPQSVHQLGGYRPQGRELPVARRLMEDALLLQEAGCFSIVLESIPARLATLISERLEIPTIGIGAGAGCDGQVLVTHDMLGIFDRFTPKFVKKYADLRSEMIHAFTAYKNDVEANAFPTEIHSVEMPDEKWDIFIKEMGNNA